MAEGEKEARLRDSDVVDYLRARLEIAEECGNPLPRLSAGNLRDVLEEVEALRRERDEARAALQDSLRRLDGIAAFLDGKLHPDRLDAAYRFVYAGTQRAALAGSPTTEVQDAD